MKKRIFLFVFIITAFIFVRRYDLPVTLTEAKEAYTSYSIVQTGHDTKGIKPGMFFNVGGETLSTIGVYARIPFIYLWGLNNRSLRLPAFIAGIFCIYIFYLLTNVFFKKDWEKYVATFLFSVSPLFVKTNIFELSLTASLLFSLLTVYLCIKKKRLGALVSGILAVLSSFSSIIIIFTIGIFFLYREKNAKNILISISVFIIILFLAVRTGTMGGYLKDRTIIGSLNPKSYTFLIDRKLSFGEIVGSPLITEKFNFNRIAQNKGYYFINELLKSIISPFDYETLTSPLQAKTILEAQFKNLNKLPGIFFWEFPLIFIGMILLLDRKNVWLNLFLISGIISSVVFQNAGIVFLLPVIVISEVLLIQFLYDKSGVYRKLLIVIAVLFFFGYFSFYDLLIHHENLWLPQNIQVQYKIWKEISNDQINNNAIIVTDRVGEPAYFLFYYHMIDPVSVQKAKRVDIKGQNIERIENIGKFRFGAFNYLDEDKSKNQIWVGFPGEFLGQNVTPKDRGLLRGGYVFKVIEDVATENRLMGNEIWFVKIE